MFCKMYSSIYIPFTNLDCADIIGKSEKQQTTMVENKQKNTLKWRERRIINEPVNISDILSSLG